MFYDKVKGANPEDLYQLLSKRVGVQSIKI